MALNKKKSRKIVVDDIEYRWIVRESSGYRELTAQAADGNGQKMHVVFDSRWGDSAAGHGFDASLDRPVLVATPLFVAEAIKFALNNGWRPNLSGETFRFDHNGDAFLARSNRSTKLPETIYHE